VEAMKAGGFGINGEKWFAGESLEKALELGLVLDQANGWMRPISGRWGGDHSERSPRALPRRNQSQSFFDTRSRPAAISSSALDKVL
jgi:hypothetical protein